MRTLTLIAVFTALALPSYAQDSNKTEATILDISAQADVKAEPDIATISAGVVSVGKTADAAMKENATRMNAIFKALKAAGIEDKNQQTSGITVSPQYVYQENKSPVITGYQANNNVNVTIHDLKKISSVLDALVAQGANQLNGPNFTLDNPEQLLNDARKEAVKKARDRAELYASAVGMKIKRIRTISESSSFGGPIPYPMMARKVMAMDAGTAESTPVAMGQVNLNANVNISYELE